MEKSNPNSIAKHANLTVAPPENTQEGDVERLLEHILSPYRWEMLESHSLKSRKAAKKKSEY